MEIFRLFGSILINNDDANNSLAKTDSKAQSVASTLGKGVATAAKWGAAIGSAAAGAATGMYKLATGAASTADDIDKMSQKIGVSREAYQELTFAMSQSGSEVSDLQAGMKSLRSAMDALGGKSNEPQIDTSKVQSALAKYNNALLDAESAQKAYDAAVAKSGEHSEEAEKALLKLSKAQNTVLDKEAQYNKALEGTTPKLSEAANALKTLGINAVDANGNLRDDEEVMFETIAALQNMTNETEKARYAALLFGKSGTELMPLLNGAAGSLDEMRQQAHDLGLVLDNELIDNGVNLTDALDQMKRSLGAVVTQLGGRLMPIVEKAADFITGNIPKINRLVEQIAPIFEQAFDEILPVILDLTSELLPEVIEMVTALLPPISRIFSALAPIVSELVQKLAPVIVRLVDKLLPPLVDIIDALTPLLDIILEILDPVLDLVTALIDPIAEILKMLSPIISFGLEIIKDIIEPIMPLIKATADLLGNVLGGAVSSVAALIGDGLIPVLKGFYDFLNGDFERGITEAGDGLINVFSNALGVIDGIFGTNLQKWYSEVTAFWRDAGAKLYEVFHADELAAIEEQNTYGGLGNDVKRLSNEYMRNGMSAEAALEQAKTEILDTAEKAAYFNQMFSDVDAEDARRRYDTLSETGQIPRLASGGVVYGKTLAFVGDNENVRNDPEVVAPLSQLRQMNINGDEETKAIMLDIRSLLSQLVNMLPGALSIDGQKISTVVANRINGMRYNRGGEVIY